MDHPRPAAAIQDRGTRFRWVVVAMLFAIIFVNYVDRSAISYAIGPLARELSLSDAQKGLVLGAFGFGYAVTTLVGGVLVDRFGARIVLAVSVVLWALATAFTGLASSFLLLLIARAMLGLAEGPMFPGQTGAIGRWLSDQERVRAFGYSLVAVPISLAVGAPIVSFLIESVGWRATFFVLGGISVLWMPLWWVLFRDDPGESRRVDAAERAWIGRRRSEHPRAEAGGSGAYRTSWRMLLTDRTLLANYWAFFAFGYFLFFFMTWLPSYLARAFGLDTTSVGWFSVMPWLLAAAVLIAMGNLSDRLLERTRRLRVARSYLIAGSQAVAALVILPVTFIGDLTSSLVLISIAVASSMGANAAYYAVNVDVARDRAATALGIMGFGFAISGFVAPALTGWLVGAHGGFTTAFLLMVALAASSVVVTLAFHRPDSRGGADGERPDGGDEAVPR